MHRSGSHGQHSTGRSAIETIDIVRDLNLKGYHSVSSGATLINREMEFINEKKMPGSS